jgi:hypothetical protein
MVYTNNVPQGNQTVAFTQPLIQANFGFLQDAIGLEHVFDPTDPLNTAHQHASMPNQPDPVTLPPGTNGQYYINGGVPKFYNGSNYYYIPIGLAFTQIYKATVPLSATSTVIFTFPNQTAGSFYLVPPAAPPPPTITPLQASATGQFVAANGFVKANGLGIVGLTLTQVGLNLEANTTNPAFNGNYTVIVLFSSTA